jgi:hypothetical protein
VIGGGGTRPLPVTTLKTVAGPKKTNEVFQETRFNFGSRKLLLFVFPVFLFTLTLIFRKKYRYTTREEKVVKKLMTRVRKKYPAALIEPGTGIMDLAKMVNEPAVHQFAELYCSACTATGRA